MDTAVPGLNGKQMLGEAIKKMMNLLRRQGRNCVDHMAKRSYPSNDFYKHRDGPKRQARMNEWYENKQGHAEAKNFFSAENVVPNNPTNYQSFTPVASQFAPQGQPSGDVVFRRNPYGDAEQIVQSEGPSFQRPTQMGSYFSAPDVDPALDKPALPRNTWSR